MRLGDEGEGAPAHPPTYNRGKVALRVFEFEKPRDSPVRLAPPRCRALTKGENSAPHGCAEPLDQPQLAGICFLYPKSKSDSNRHPDRLNHSNDFPATVVRGCGQMMWVWPEIREADVPVDDDAGIHDPGAVGVPEAVSVPPFGDVVAGAVIV